jgi:alkyl sulfatase BDS1-like metallo-beta-lactamase superfamily hydrolase
MGLVRDTSEKLLSGALTTETLSPMTPCFELDTVRPGVHFVSSFANVTAFETTEGLVLVDVGSFVFAERTREVLRSVGHAPVTHAIYTHGHVDHCFGVELYEAEPEGRPVHVVAHRGVERRFERYAMTRGYNSTINQRQFQTSTEFPGEFRRPNQTFEDVLDLEVGGRVFQLHHAMGETDDHTWVFEPESRVLCTGDLFIWASPNCGNPQKVQRYPLEWANALRAMAALEPEVLCPGHGVPIWGRAAVHAALTNTASYLESIVHQVLALMNDGARLDTILGAVRPPEDLQQLPYLRPVYDEPEFIVRNVVRLYGGWWDGNPANLKPAREREIAREITALMGGAAPLIARAEALVAAGDLPLACHLIEIAAASPDAPTSVFALRKAIYAQRAAGESSLMARGIFAGVG